MNDNSNSLTILSDRQRKFLGFVACFAGVLILGCLLAAVIIILNRTFDLFGGVIWSLAVSGMLAILLRPIVSFFEEKVRLGRFSSILLLYALVMFTSGSYLVLGGKVINQTKNFWAQLTGLNNLKKKPNNLYPLRLGNLFPDRLMPLRILEGSLGRKKCPLLVFSKISNYFMISILTNGKLSAPNQLKEIFSYRE